jgi:hypothetical protein
MLPVLMADGPVEWFALGKPFADEGKEPSGCWARHESLMDGRWKRWKLMPGKIVCETCTPACFKASDTTLTTPWPSVA